MRLKNLRAIFSLTLLLGLTPLGLAEGLPDLGEASQQDLSPQEETRIGERAMQEFRSDPAYLNDAEVVAYINHLGNRLTSHLDQRTQAFEFFVLKDKTLNAFAMPGGFIGVHTGLIQAAQSESELASVLAHEISHVTQHHMARMASKQNQAQVPMLVAMAIALVAGRRNTDIGAGGLAAAQAGVIQQQLGYSRDFEREADRMGFQLLQRSGFDAYGMESFFERLQQSSRLYENNAPAYLMTHPLTSERIADMANRAQHAPYRQVRDSVDFILVRAKLQALDGSPRDAVQEAETRFKEHRYANATAIHYTLATAYLRAANHAAAAREVAELRHLKAQSPMIESLAAAVLQAQGDSAGAEKTLRAAMHRYPQERALPYALIQTLTDNRKLQEAARLINANIELYPTDYRLYEAQAKVYAAMGKQLQQHRSQAEAYAKQGLLTSAIEQLQLAQRAPDGNFYDYSQVDARLRQLKQKQADEAKKPKL